MKNAVTLLSVTCLLMSLAAPAAADWEEGDGHKMHWPQLPKPGGWNVAFNLGRLADDWECSESGPVEDVHFWVSWDQDQVQPIAGFSVRIHSDVPDPDGPAPLYSMPAGDFLFEQEFYPGKFTVDTMPDDLQGWFDPLTGICATNDHVSWAQINIVEIEQPFIQTEGVTYWLEIDAWRMPAPGWKESGSPHYRDDAVAWISANWIELRDPVTQNSLDLGFVMTPEPMTLVLVAVGGVAALRRRRKF